MRRPSRAPRLLLLAVVLATVGYLTVVSVQVLLTARGEELPADVDAIVVLGAAQYDGVPSPALARRLNHALGLWQEGVAPIVVVTGGRAPGDRFDEATAGRTWLHQRGVPEEAIRREVHSRNTYDQLAATARFLDEEGVEHVVLVSHPLHGERLRLTADEVGLQAVFSPASTEGTTAELVQLGVREAVAVATGRIISFRRLRNLLQQDVV